MALRFHCVSLTAFPMHHTRANMSEPGHNANGQLKSIVERIERLELERKSIGDDIKDIYAESKGGGYDVKALRTIIRLRREKPEDRAAREAVLETYMHALGML